MKKHQEVIAFHKLRDLFPDKTTISTAHLKVLKKEEENKVHLGPGVY